MNFNGHQFVDFMPSQPSPREESGPSVQPGYNLGTDDPVMRATQAQHKQKSGNTIRQKSKRGLYAPLQPVPGSMN